MKKLFFVLAIGLAGLSACDKAENPYPPAPVVEDIYAYYPDGDSTHYADNVWPTFTANNNTDRNVLIEDFTGHQCNFCPPAAALAVQLENTYPDRIITSTIHTGPTGTIENSLQDLLPPAFVIDFTNPEGLAIGLKFGQDWPGSLFEGNPYGTINRVDHGNGFPVLKPQLWTPAVDATIAANELKVNIQSVSNYYPSTRGLFLHSEVEILDLGLNPDDLRIVVHLLEDSFIAPQKLFDNSTDYNYEHHDLFRGSVDGLTYGKPLDAEYIASSGNYEFFHFYELPTEYDPDNMHVIIYVRDAVTEEVYQVIKQEF